MSRSSESVYVGNDNILELRGLRDEITGVWVNNATVTITVTGAAGAVAGESWPKDMSYVIDSDGVYRTTLGAAAQIVDGGRYEAVIDVVVSGLHARWQTPLIGKARR